MDLPTVLGSQNVELCEEAANNAAEELSLFGAKIAIVRALGVIESCGNYSSVSFLGVWEEAGDGFKSRHYVLTARKKDGEPEQACIYPQRGARARRMAGIAQGAVGPIMDSSVLVRVGELLEHFLSILSGIEALAEPEAWMNVLGVALLGPEESSRWRSQRERAQLSDVAHSGWANESGQRI